MNLRGLTGRTDLLSKAARLPIVPIADPFIGRNSARGSRESVPEISVSVERVGDARYHSCDREPKP